VSERYVGKLHVIYQSEEYLGRAPVPGDPYEERMPELKSTPRDEVWRRRVIKAWFAGLVVGGMAVLLGGLIANWR
jgi:hypothetical protein